jgi:hypothetical protein
MRIARMKIGSDKTFENDPESGSFFTASGKCIARYVVLAPIAVPKSNATESF